MKVMQKATNINDVDKTMDEINEQTQIQEALSAPIGYAADFDEDELEAELQEHIQEKESQLTELQEQNRIAQETILYKDEQLKEAQGSIARAQEMDALQSSTNHSLQAELRERTEQYSQLWHGCQRQFTEMERLHWHTVQLLQFQLANVREGGDPKTNSNGASQIIQNIGNQFEAHGNSSENANVNVHSNGKNADNISSFISSDDRATQALKAS